MSYSNILEAAGFNEPELSGGTLAVHSPVDGSEIACLKTHSVDDVQAMIGKGVDAFKSWRNTPAPRRGELVRLIGEELRAEKENLGRLVSLERQLQTVQQENQSLKDRTARDWFMVGAAVVLLGIIIGLIIPKIRFRKKSSWDTF